MSYLVKRPVAFRVRRSDENNSGWRLFNDEHKAYEESEQTGAEMQALYARDGEAIVGEWQPIETAPKGDDDLFLVCGRSGQASVMRGAILWSGRRAGTPSHLHLLWLTHWMPLPAPPKLET